MGIILGCIVLAACPNPVNNEPEPLPVTVNVPGIGSNAAAGSLFYRVPASGLITLEIDVPANTRVYYQFTNAATMGSDTDGVSMDGVPGLAAGKLVKQQPAARTSNQPPYQGRIDADFSAEYAQIRAMTSRDARTATHRNLQSAVTVPWAEGNTWTYKAKEFAGSKTFDKPLVLKKIVEDDGRKVLFWVEAALYSASDADKKVDASELNRLADAFFQSGGDNDIYDWLTGVFGAEWGSVDDTRYIGDTKEIHICIYDIDNDQSTTGGIFGYYNPWNNLVNGQSINGNQVAESKERLLFAMDAPMLDSDNWENEIISTLGHEFQHMIHFYQKAVLHGGKVWSDEWINEMCSLMAEDLLAESLGIPGPRGETASGGDYGQNESEIAGSRVASACASLERPLTIWDTTQDYSNYGRAYLFGAWLARNYGGQDLFREIVQNEHNGLRAISAAIQKVSGSSLNFADLLAQYAVAVFHSDRSDMPAGYRLNNATAGFEGGLNDTKKLASINAWAHTWTWSDRRAYNGPSIWTAPLTSFAPASIQYVADESNDSPTARHLSRTMTLPRGISLTVLYGQ